MRRVGIVLAALVSLLVMPPAAAGPDTGTPGLGDTAEAADDSQVTIGYEVSTRGEVHADFAHFAEAVRLTLYDTRGWWQAGVNLRPVAEGGQFEVILASPAAVDAAHEVCSPQWSCRVGNQVLINDVRWRQGTEAFTGPIGQYRRYLLNHEVGHWLGLGHFDCPGPGATAPVMLQQSIDLEGCEPNGWPLDHEIEAVAAQQGTTPREPVDFAVQGIAHACEAVELGAAEWQFPDIDGYADDVQDAIRCAAAHEITTGYEDGAYRPDREIRRHEMALFLTRMLDHASDAGAVDLPEEPSHPFTDLEALRPEIHDAVATLYELEITAGVGEDRYAPFEHVTRRDMASFLVRLQDEIEPGSYETDATNLFPDVPETLDRHTDINALAAHGIVQGFAGGTYRPTTSVDRAQMALFVMRQIDENVESGRLPALQPDADE